MYHISYSYYPANWNQEEFINLGGFVVVFLNYNKGERVSPAVESALNQDYPLVEMIFLDDNSIDGSGDTMESLVRAYRGRHKVSVVRNEENQTIAGQWNIAARVATGHWLGMFCGDDVSFPDRVSRISELVKQYPSAWGICTNALIEGSVTDTFCANRSRGTWSGEEGNAPPENMFGGMAFWRRDIFDTELPRCNMDDYLLQYMVMIRCAKVKDVSLVWALDINTVCYSLTGITNIAKIEAESTKSHFLRIWRIGKARRDFDRKYGLNVWRLVLSYADKFLSPGVLFDQIRGLTEMYTCQSCGWWKRLGTFIRLHTVLRHDPFGGIRLRITREVDRRFLAQFFGLPGFVLYTLLAEWRLRRMGILK